mgnify:CR=1 FL=1
MAVSVNQTAGSGDYNPLSLPTVDMEKFKADKQSCFKQVETETSKEMAQNYNIIKFRECLIQKGYVLLSWSFNLSNDLIA